MFMMRRVGRGVCPGMAAALLAPAALTAQAEERGSFVVLMGSDTFAVERYARGPRELSSDMTIRGMGRVVWSARLAADGTVSALELRGWAPGAPEGAAPLQRGTLDFRGDSAHLALEGAGQRLARAMGGARGAVPYINPSPLLTERILLAARRMGGDSVEVPVLPVGAPAVEKARVVWRDADSASLWLGPVEVVARVDPAGRLLRGAVPAQNIVIEHTAADVHAALKPDFSAPAGAPYTAEEVAVPTPGGFTLAGTLTLPKGAAGPVPAVVTITGSGMQDRDETVQVVPGYRPMRQIADTLARRGIATLRFDDRGFGGSGGDVSQATSADFADDVRAVVAYLRARPEIDPDRIALVGHSEGGVIAPMVAATDPQLRAVVLVAGTSRPGQRVIDYQIRYGVEQDTAMRPEKRDSAVAAYRVQFDSLAAANPWFGWFVAHDPLPTARRVRQPVLILQGATDRQVTADQAGELAAALREAGNRDVTVHVFPDVNHLLLRDPVGAPAGYARLPSGVVVPEVLGALADWLDTKLRGG
jgi:uncharacterized protein